MNARQRLNDLLNTRANHITDAETALAAGNMEDYQAALDAATAMNDEIAAVQAIVAEMDRFGASQPAAAPAGGSGALGVLGGEAAPAPGRRSTNEYVRAFCDAVRARVSVEDARANASGRFQPLVDSLTETGGTPTGTDGGFLVPDDLQTRINELRRELSPLADLVTVENVTALTGYRVIDTAPTAGFTAMDEMAQIPTDDQPAFTRVQYTVKDYGLIVPISNDLMSDNDAGLMEYLARWMAKKSVLTENAIILAKLAALSATAIAAGGELKGIKTVLNKTLDPAIAANARVLTNQSGFNTLDNLIDTNNRPMIQPDPTATTGKLFAGHGMNVVSDSTLANVTTTSPVYIGDFSQFITLFRRQPMEFTTTNVGGSSWRTNSTEGRAIMRCCAMTMDNAAVKALTLVTA